MTGEPDREISIFLEAIEIDEFSELSAFLHKACGDDERLRARVEALLAVHRRDDSFLDRPAPGLVKTVDIDRDMLEAGIPVKSAPHDYFGRAACLTSRDRAGVIVWTERNGLWPKRRNGK
jgi:hypothetical protein